MPTVPLEEIRCECCGIPFSLRPGTISGTARGTTTILCNVCEGLISSGLLRPEVVKGRTRYRQWHIQPMVAGRLMPAVEQVWR